MATVRTWASSSLWAAADKLRGHLDAAEYKHVVLGLIFLKYISDAFEARREQLLAGVAHGADPEDPDEYRAESVFWVPTEARWERLQANAKAPEIGSLLDRVMDAIEHKNPSLRGTGSGLRPRRDVARSERHQRNRRFALIRSDSL